MGTECGNKMHSSDELPHSVHFNYKYSVYGLSSITYPSSSGVIASSSSSAVTPHVGACTASASSHNLRQMTGDVGQIGRSSGIQERSEQMSSVVSVSAPGTAAAGLTLRSGQ